MKRYKAYNGIFFTVALPGVTTVERSFLVLSCTVWVSPKMDFETYQTFSRETYVSCPEAAKARTVLINPTKASASSAVRSRLSAGSVSEPLDTVA